jgi:hypothetical protein
MDINVNDDHTVGCTVARAAVAHLSNSDDCSHNDYGSDGSGVDSCYPVGLKTDSDAQGSVLDATEKKNESSSLTETCNNILSLSDQLRLWTSKFTVRDGNECIDVSSAVRGELSTIPISSTRQQFPYTGTMYQFDPSLFHNPDQEFDIDDAKAKLFALMKSPHTIDGCKLV